MNYPLNKLNIAQVFGILFLASLFLPIRYVFPTKTAFQTGAYSDFTSISLYLSDIFLFITCFFFLLPRGGKLLPRGVFWKSVTKCQWAIVILIIWLILNLIWHFGTLNELNWWFALKYAELIVAYETVAYLFSKTAVKTLFLQFFVLFSSLEAILAIWQFIIQKSVGGVLHKLGEQILSPTLPGIAKIVSGGTTYIRGYGTFPHPNLLSAFLVTGIFFTLYFLIQANNLKGKILFSVALLVNILGLSVTFSRAAYVALAAGILLFFFVIKFWSILHSKNNSTEEVKLNSKKIIWAMGIVLVCLVSAVAIFGTYLASRDTVTDSASKERIFYAKIGLQMIEQHPVFGEGIGESVIHMQQYSPIKLWPWQIQPIHNYFLLAAAELGMVGALILLWIFYEHFFALIKKIKTQINFEHVTYSFLLTTILASFLALMQFDHYFYTLQQTQMLLWVILGLFMAEIKNPQ